jgi:hypothetical protein
MESEVSTKRVVTILLAYGGAIVVGYYLFRIAFAA